MTELIYNLMQIFSITSLDQMQAHSCVIMNAFVEYRGEDELIRALWNNALEKNRTLSDSIFNRVHYHYATEALVYYNINL